MIPETTQWTCDRCQKLIETSADGRIEWIDGVVYDVVGRHFQLVHGGPSALVPSPDCPPDEEDEYQRNTGAFSSYPMTEFLGPDGLAEFLDILDTKVLPMGDVFTMIQRLH